MLPTKKLLIIDYQIVYRRGSQQGFQFGHAEVHCSKWRGWAAEHENLRRELIQRFEKDNPNHQAIVCVFLHTILEDEI